MNVRLSSFTLMIGLCFTSLPQFARATPRVATPSSPQGKPQAVNRSLANVTAVAPGLFVGGSGHWLIGRK